MSSKCFCQVVTAAFAALLITPTAAADVAVRVDARPRSGPIEAYVLATGDDGPISDLVADNFLVTVDGVPIGPFALTLPPRQDPMQRLSVVIVASTGLRSGYPVTHVDVYEALVRKLLPGDFVAVVLMGYGAGNDGFREGRVSVLPFRPIDGGAHTEQILDFLNTSQSDLAQVFSDFSFVYLTERGVHHALKQFEQDEGRLPIGPRAVVAWSIWTRDLEEIVARANRSKVSFFTRHLLDRGTVAEYYMAQRALADNTGGVVVEVPPDSGSAMPVIAAWLHDGYRLTIPAAIVDDCELHMLEITTRGMHASAPFTRCDAIPDAIEFPSQTGVSRGSTVVSEARRVRGMGSPAPVSVVRGEYSIGCGQAFTTEPGYVRPGQSICVRHSAAWRPGARSATKLIIGGVTSWFESFVAL